MDNWWGECPNCEVGELYGGENRENVKCHYCGYEEEYGEITNKGEKKQSQGGSYE